MKTLKAINYLIAAVSRPARRIAGTGNFLRIDVSIQGSP